MIDGLVLQTVLNALVIISTIIASVWFIGGITEKSAAWIILVAVPCAIVTAIFIAMLIW